MASPETDGPERPLFSLRVVCPRLPKARKEQKALQSQQQALEALASQQSNETVRHQALQAEVQEVDSWL